MTMCLRKQDLDWREIDDEIVALDGRDGVYLSVQGSGVMVWGMLVDSTTREDLIAALVERYGIEPTTAAADLDPFLAALDTRGLLAA